VSASTVPGSSSEAGQRRPPARWDPGLVLAVIFTVVYACFLTRNYYWDGLSFAMDIERVPSWRGLLNVHHLLYNLIGYGEYLALGRTVRALYLMQWTNCLAGGALIWLTYRLLRSLDVPAANSAACAAIIATAATFWKFSTDADSYVLANVFLVAAYLVLPRAPARGALLHVSAMMMHQLAALFYPVALALLWRHYRERFWRAALAYTVISAGLTLALYRVAYSLATQKPPVTFTGWLTFHAQVPFSFNASAAAGWLALGTARLFAGGKFEPVAYGAAPISLALLVWAALQLARNRGRFLPVLPAWPLLVWASVYIVFLLTWEPYNTFYRLFYLTPLVGLLAVATRAVNARPLALVAAALLTWNFAAYIYPNSRADRNPQLRIALEHRQEWPAGTGVVFSEIVPDLWTIVYFNPQVSWISIGQPDPARVAEAAALCARRGGKLYLDWTYLNRAGRPAPRFYFERVRAPEPTQAPSTVGRPAASQSP
jgi:hypothetical protein